VIEKRKVGRLKVYENAIDYIIRNRFIATALLKDDGETYINNNAFVNINLFADKKGGYSKKEKKDKKSGKKEILEEITKLRQRFYNVLMFIALYIIISKREKR
jgi:hypothetical protein